jgi:predicted DNA-binding ribbon-helix-helix protein
MKSLIVKRSVVISGHKTSVSLEEPFWTALKEIARRRKMQLSDLVSSIDRDRNHTNLSSGIRLFILHFYTIQLGGRPRREHISMGPAAAPRIRQA